MRTSMRGWASLSAGIMLKPSAFPSEDHVGSTPMSDITCPIISPPAMARSLLIHDSATSSGKRPCSPRYASSRRSARSQPTRYDVLVGYMSGLEPYRLRPVGYIAVFPLTRFPAGPGAVNPPEAAFIKEPISSLARMESARASSLRSRSDDALPDTAAFTASSRPSVAPSASEAYRTSAISSSEGASPNTWAPSSTKEDAAESKRSLALPTLRSKASPGGPGITMPAADASSSSLSEKEARYASPSLSGSKLPT